MVLRTIIPALVWAVFVFFPGAEPLYPQQGVVPRIERGVLRISDSDLTNRKPLALDGEWEFHWQKFQPPSEPSEIQYFRKLPDSWEIRKDGTTPFPPHGYATYRLRLEFPDSGVRSLGLRLNHLNTAFRLYIDGKLTAQAGSPGTNRLSTIPASRVVNVYFGTTNRTVDLLIHLANFEHIHGGIEYSVYFGSASSISALRVENSLIDIFLVGVLFIFGLYHLGLFALRRKDRTAVFFGILCLTVAFRTLLTGEMLIYDFVHGLGWSLANRLEYFSVPAITLLFYSYFRHLFPLDFNRFLSRIFIGAGFAYGVLILFSPNRVYATLLPFYHFAILIMGVYVLIGLGKAALHKRSGIGWVIGGFVVFFGVAVNDILYANSVIRTGYYLPFGVLVFIFTQAYIIAVRFSQAFLRIEEISHELSIHKSALEDTVKDRTMELARERNELRMRIQLMEGDLDLARKIQLSLIPLSNPRPFISCYYQPMEKVGGDFYDFVKFPDSGMIGVFIGDVSGHGVAAAFITSMLKGSILQVAPLIANPSEFMAYLNDTLITQTGGNFITAFYGIYHERERRLVYSSAGHQSPWAIDRRGEISSLSIGKRGLPLSVFVNEELGQIGKPFRDDEAIFEHGTRLVFYTDGLLEAVSGDLSGQDFEETELLNAMSELHQLPGDEFLMKLIGRLLQFHGRDRLDDDLCLVTLDVK